MEFSKWINEGSLYHRLRRRFGFTGAQTPQKEDDRLSVRTAKAPDGSEWVFPKHYGEPEYKGGPTDHPRSYGYIPKEYWDEQLPKIRRDMDIQGEHVTPGGKMFREWLKKRVLREQQAGSGVEADLPGEVKAPTDPKEIARRKAVNDMTSQMMKKNPALKPGKTDQQQVANLTSSDPTVAKADPETQQAVSNFFLKK
jgi:hypothetical protein